MEHRNSTKRNAALDSFVASSKEPRDQNDNPNFIANQSCSSSVSASSSPITTNTLTCSTEVGTIYATTSSLNTENLPLKPTSSSKMNHAGVSQTNQHPPSQPRLAAYTKEKEDR